MACDTSQSVPRDTEHTPIFSSPTRLECLPDGPSNNPPGSATIHLWSKALVNACARAVGGARLSRIIDAVLIPRAPSGSSSWLAVGTCGREFVGAGSLRRRARGCDASLLRWRARVRLRCPHGARGGGVYDGTDAHFCSTLRTSTHGNCYDVDVASQKVAFVRASVKRSGRALRRRHGGLLGEDWKSLRLAATG